ncbi:ankyrin repeat protein [Megavirus baoshan]|uniref:Ankyrin repeat protein n=1 Tax=Megavirus baoshan TaxID=2496520 RepID=A0A3Q8U888_9VIRU|nr:ankyrin repeat protein [Megavirus baoshan]AZL89592.1 ankyrin repeat protein [Megavirus baoshan]
MFACKHSGISNYTEIVKLLIYNHADLNIINNKGLNVILNFCINIETNDINNLLLLIDHGADYNYVYNGKSYVSFLKEKYILQCFNRISLKNHYKLMMKRVHNDIKNYTNKILFKPDSMRFRLVILKMNLEIGDIKKCITWNNLELFDYLSVYDFDSLKIKYMTS